MATTHTPSIEEKWNAYWATHQCYKSTPTSSKKAYTMIMPPPNVTGILHMGHILNNTIQDVLVRKERMQGKEACWVPGLDHASIATEAKVVALLREQGITKEALGREGFLEKAWEWKEKYGDIIVSQLKKMGISCDWSRLKFTMDPQLSQAVTKAFVDWYEQGKIYRGKRIIHWDPKGKTALSDEEVLYKEVPGKLYYIRYAIVGKNDHITIATSRPETLLGDTAICVHPTDTRYQHLHGEQAYVPLLNRVIPIITDTYVDPTFGTGCLKVTPAHDMQDYILGEKHGLPIINIFTEEGKMSSAAEWYVGEEVSVARTKIVEELTERNLLTKVEDYLHKVGFSERTNAVVEPKISTQWFVKMKELATPAIQAVEDSTIAFYPAKFVNMYMAWMRNIKDWCISRQLWWGHRLPVYYLPDNRYVVASSIEKAVEKAREKSGNPTLSKEELVQDPDVLDTWFSSALWPFSVFNGTLSPENEDISYYYPTQDLVTAPEIIFFWVARMIMAGYAFKELPPFRNVYFTGIVRDKQGRKMSKSLGNSPDALALMEKYGADGVRAGMLFSSPAGNDLLFDEKLCQQGAQFSHKIHHALQLVQSWQPSITMTTSPTQKVAIEWFSARYQEVLHQTNHHFKQFKLSEILILLYKFIWEDFCGGYLEMLKPTNEKKEIAKEAYEVVIQHFEQVMQLLHPFMPFITEEVWHQLKERKKGISIALTTWPKATAYDESLLKKVQLVLQAISTIRKIKSMHGWTKEDRITLHLQSDTPDWLQLLVAYFLQVTKITTIVANSSEPINTTAFVLEDTTFWLSTANQKENEHYLASRELELVRLQKFLQTIEAKLSNARFVEHAKLEVVNREKKKKQDTEAKIAILQALLKK